VLCNGVCSRVLCSALLCCAVVLTCVVRCMCVVLVAAGSMQCAGQVVGTAELSQGNVKFRWNTPQIHWDIESIRGIAVCGRVSSVWSKCSSIIMQSIEGEEGIFAHIGSGF
jgi:hypothetical protein